MTTEKIQSGEKFSVQKNGAHVADAFTETPGVYGKTTIRVNDEVVFDKSNLIVGGSGTTTPTGLKAYLAQSLNANIDRGLNDLFTVSDISSANYNIYNQATVNASFAAKDGILIAAGESSSSFAQGIYAMITTSQTAANTYGRKWRGTFTATGARSIRTAALGNAVKGNTTGDVLASESWDGDDGYFATTFAKQTFQTITLSSGDVLTIDWEIYIV
jgi:hypothetical protein